MLSLTIDLKSRFKNKAFLLSLISAIVLLIQQLGFKDLIPGDYQVTVNSILNILVMLGIIIDPSTPSVSDQIAAQTTVQAINQEQTKEEVKAEATTTAINSQVTENSQAANTDLSNSASSKIMVDVPNE